MDKVAEKLDNINKTLEGILKILSTPENKVMTVIKYAGAGGKRTRFSEYRRINQAMDHRGLT